MQQEHQRPCDRAGLHDMQANAVRRDLMVFEKESHASLPRLPAQVAAPRRQAACGVGHAMGVEVRTAAMAYLGLRQPWLRVVRNRPEDLDPPTRHEDV